MRKYIPLFFSSIEELLFKVAAKGYSAEIYFTFQNKFQLAQEYFWADGTFDKNIDTTTDKGVVILFSAKEYFQDYINICKSKANGCIQ